MKRKIVILLAFCCLSLAACGESSETASSVATWEQIAGEPGSAASAELSSSSASTEESLDYVNMDHRAVLVTIVDRYISDHGLDIATPDIASEDWFFAYDPSTGFYNATVTGKDSSGQNNQISAWIELVDDTNYSIHYLSTRDGDLIDDGEVND